MLTGHRRLLRRPKDMTRAPFEAGASVASDKALAKKLLLVLSDMADRWNGSRNSPGASRLAGCTGVPANGL